MDTVIMAPTAAEETVDLGTVFSAAATYRWLMAACAGLGLLLAVLFLHAATPRYTAAVQLVATDQNAGVGRNLSGLASLAGVNLPRSSTSQFPYLLSTLGSRDVADVLAADNGIMRHFFPRDWDVGQHRWRQPPDGLRPLKSGIKSLLGMPVLAWHPPGAVDLQQALQKHLGVDEDQRRSIATVSFSDPDGPFAATLLGRIYKAADGNLRDHMIRRTTGNIQYLDEKLATVTLAEHREALARTLAEQEQSLMLAKSGAPFAAEPLGVVSVGDRPTWPNVPLTLAAGLVAGTVLGLVVAFWRYYRQLRRARVVAVADTLPLDGE